MRDGRACGGRGGESCCDVPLLIHGDNPRLSWCGKPLGCILTTARSKRGVSRSNYSKQTLPLGGEERMPTPRRTAALLGGRIDKELLLDDLDQGLGRQHTLGPKRRLVLVRRHKDNGGQAVDLELGGQLLVLVRVHLKDPDLKGSRRDMLLATCDQTRRLRPRAHLPCPRTCPRPSRAPWQASGRGHTCEWTSKLVPNARPTDNGAREEAERTRWHKSR